MRIFGLRSATTGAVLMAAVCATTPASASLVYSFNGVISGSPPTELINPFFQNDTFFGTFTIDETVADSHPTPGRGIFAQALIDFSVTYSNGYEASSAHAAYLFSWDAPIRFSRDIYGSGGRATGPSVNGNTLSSWNFDFTGPETVFSGDTLNSNIQFNDFTESRILTLTFASPAGVGVELSGQFTDVSLVPLPAALPLFSAGLGAIRLLGWRRKQSAA